MAVNFPDGLSISAASTASADLVSTASINSLNMNTRNFIINGNFDVWQRGTSFTAIGAGSYSADRFRNSGTTDAVLDVFRSTDVPTISSTAVGSSYSLHYDVTTADSSIGAAQRYAIYHAIEGQVYKNIHSKQVTLSFWVKSTKTGIFTVGFSNSAADRSYPAEYTINSSNTWEKKTITLTLDSSGTWLFTNGIGLSIFFNLAIGSNFQGTANTWQSGFLIGTANQVNALDSTANDFKLSQVQLELGSQATPFKQFGGNFISNLMACYRYAYSPLSEHLRTEISSVEQRIASYGANDLVATFPLPVPMRASVSIANATETTNITIAGVGSGAVTGFTFTIAHYSENSIGLNANKTTHGLTDARFILSQTQPATIFTSEL